jgi:hypothetical protein
MAAFMGIVMVGFLAVALDVGYLFHEKRMAQSAADAAAVAAAEELSNGTTAETNAANAMAKLNGFDTTLATNPASVTLAQSTSGNYSNLGSAPAPNTWVTAVVSRPIQTFFLGAFAPTMSKLTVAASATAGVGAASSNCLCLQGTSGTDLSVSGGSSLSTTGCQISANSTSSNAISVTGGSKLCAQTISAASSNWVSTADSGATGSGSTICGTAHQVNSGPTCNKTMAMPALPNGITCYPDPTAAYASSMAGNSLCASNYNACYTLPLQNAYYMKNNTPTAIPNEVAVSNTICYQSLDLSHAGGGQVVFSPGYTYYIQGNYTTGGGVPSSGTGVQFYVGGTLTLSNGANQTYSAPQSNGTYGVLFYDAGTTAVISGGSNTTLNGIIYAPSTAMSLSGGTSTSFNLDFVSSSLSITGGSTLTSFQTPALAASGAGVAALAQ